MTEVYSKKLIKMTHISASEFGIELKEGVYIFMQGPMYETPAEIKALSFLGADAVGMSTVPEAIVAKHANMDVIGISCITNMASGIFDKPLNHSEVVTAAKEAENKFSLLITSIIDKWD